MGFSQKRVARLLGHPNEQMLSRYERGRCLPPLMTALQLEIIYRVPLAFLSGRKYEELRKGIREKEEKLSLPTQAVLF
jgi:transcriptional regulator with XRE-family HTH domain